MAKHIWIVAELRYFETRSYALLQQTLIKEGFQVESGIADIPTSFVSSYRNGKLVLGILAEFDALPGLSQDSTPYQKTITEGGTGWLRTQPIWNGTYGRGNNHQRLAY